VNDWTRPDWDAWALGIAEAVALRGDCTRRRVGAVLLDGQHRIIGSGYNGTEPGGKSCLMGECPRGRHFEYGANSQWEKSGDALLQCRCGKPWPCEDAVPLNSSYDTGPGVCIASHAEQNALADVESRYRLEGATLYVTAEPCGGCLKQVQNTTPVARLVWPGGELKLRA
jgi:dCMP deaminase